MESRPSSDNFVGRTVIVAGGTGRLGRVICLALAKEGADVIVNDVNVTAVTELVAELTGAGLTVHGITMSAVEEKEIVSQALSKYGRLEAVISASLGPVPLQPSIILARSTFVQALSQMCWVPSAWPKPHGPVAKLRSMGELSTSHPIRCSACQPAVLTRAARVLYLD